MTAPFTRVLVPTDFSEAADAALGYARALTTAPGSSIHLLHVFSDPYTMAAYAPEVYVPLPPDVRENAVNDIRRRLQERLEADGPPRPGDTVDVATGLTAKAIVEYAAAHGIDVIVMGTHGRRGVAHMLLGSVAEHVVRTAHCPVLTVRGTPAAAAAGASSAAGAAQAG
jgi:nucleotide-binding universal stress UspA family protein